MLLTYEDFLYMNMGGGGVWLLQSEDHALRFGAGLRIHSGWSRGRDPVLVGMSHRTRSLDGYLNAAWRTELGTIGVRYYHDVLHSGRGDAASLRLSHNFALGEKVRLTPSIGIEWESGGRVDYYYGVRPEEELFFRPAYKGTSTTNWSAGLTGSYALSHSWSLLTGLFRTSLGSGLTDSPIVARNSSIRSFFGAGWRF